MSVGHGEVQGDPGEKRTREKEKEDGKPKRGNKGRERRRGDKEREVTIGVMNAHLEQDSRRQELRFRLPSAAAAKKRRRDGSSLKS